VHPWVIVVGSFVLMEPVTALTHRFVMHGVGKALHRSHHRNGAASARNGNPRGTNIDPHRAGTYGAHGLEANDAFPVVFAALVMVGLAVGFNVDGWSFLVPMGIGITAYGVSYALVHDVYIHRRIALPVLGHRNVPGLQRLAAAHRVHHERNGAPYGMLAPVIGWRSGSRPSHRPDDA
jgi:beta-carotene 3-hydroxylase